MILIVAVVRPVEGDFSVFGVGDERISRIGIIFAVFDVGGGLGLLLFLLLLYFIECQNNCSLLKTIRIVKVALFMERHFFPVRSKKGYWIWI